MGITVPTAKIPSGIQLSNVYISLGNEPVNVSKINKLTIDPVNPQLNVNYQVNGYYAVYADRKTSKINVVSPIRIPIGVRTVEYPSNPHQIIYSQLKQLYSNVEDVYEVPPVTFSNLTVSGDTLVSLFKDINSDSNTYAVPFGTSNIVISQDAFSQLSNAINSFQFTIETPPSPVTLTISGDTLVSLFKDINSDSNTYVIPSETSNIVITHDAFSQLSNAINSFQLTVPEVAETPV